MKNSHEKALVGKKESHVHTRKPYDNGSDVCTTCKMRLRKEK